MILFPRNICLRVGIRYKCSTQNATKTKKIVGMFGNGKADFGSNLKKESKESEDSESSAFLIDSKILLFSAIRYSWQIEYLYEFMHYYFRIDAVYVHFKVKILIWNSF